MKLLVTSDTHGRLGRVFTLLETLAPSLNGIIHLGDMVGDAEEISRSYPSLPVYRVRGNCDGYMATPDEALLELDGAKIFITHGHRYNVDRTRDVLAYKALEQGAQLALYGHTHVPRIEELGKITVANPGSPTLPRGGSGYSCAVLDIDNGKVFIRPVKL